MLCPATLHQAQCRVGGHPASLWCSVPMISSVSRPVWKPVPNGYTSRCAAQQKKLVPPVPRGAQEDTRVEEQIVATCQARVPRSIRWRERRCEDAPRRWAPDRVKQLPRGRVCKFHLSLGELALRVTETRGANERGAPRVVHLGVELHELGIQHIAVVCKRICVTGVAPIGLVDLRKKPRKQRTSITCIQYGRDSRKGSCPPTTEDGREREWADRFYSDKFSQITVSAAVCDGECGPIANQPIF